MNDIKWFYLIYFSYHTREYLMISNDIDRGWEEIEDFGYLYLDQIPYDGPDDWIIHIQNMLEEELDGWCILDFCSPCFYYNDYTVISQAFSSLLTQYNEHINKFSICE